MKHVLQVLLLTCAGTSLALAQGSVEGEKWKISTKMQMAGMSMPGSSSEMCKQPGDDTVPIKADDNCQVYDVQKSGNVQSFKMRCTGKDAMEGSAQLTYISADHYKGKMVVNAQGETMNIEYEGQKLGRCDGGEINLKAKEIEAQSKKLQALGEKQQAEACRKTAEEAHSPSSMKLACPNPADLKIFCAAAITPDKFQRLSQMERQSTDPNNQPLSESAQMCGFSAEARRTQLCGTAEAEGRLGFLASECPAQAGALAAAQCTGRSYTAIADRYRDFCSKFANNEQQADAQAAEQPGVAGKTKGLFNKGKKALGGIFSN